MKYRQWKKNYKKRYGVNPPASIDKRKQRKAAARAIKALAKVDFMESIGRAAETITGAMANLMRALGNGMDAAGTVCRNGYKRGRTQRTVCGQQLLQHTKKRW